MATIKDISKGRSDVFKVDPKDLTIIGLDTDHKEGQHPLFDERVFNTLREEDILNVILYGIKVPVTVIRNGERFEVIAGRQRVRWAREANVRLLAAGSELINVPVLLNNSLNEEDQIGVMVAENEIRSEDAIFTKAKKAARMRDYGAPMAKIAATFGVVVGTIQAWLKLHTLSDDLKDAVKAGELSANAATAFAELPREDQKKKLEEARAVGAQLGVRDAKDTVERLKDDGEKLDLKAPSLREMKALLKADNNGKIYLESKTKEALKLLLGAVEMPEDLKAGLAVVRGEA